MESLIRYFVTRHMLVNVIVVVVVAVGLLQTSRSSRETFPNVTLPTLTIAESCRGRWQVEPIFKWIKRHLRIDSFFGTSENAVKTQIRIAVSV